MRAVASVVFLCFAAVGLGGPPAGDPDDAKYDEELLRQAGLTPSAEALAAFFAERSPPDADLAKIDGLVRQLGSTEFDEREKASAKLTALGPAAAPALLRAMSDKEVEVRDRATKCFRQIEARCDPGVCIPAVRALARSAPDKAPAVLLRRLPFAWPDEREAIWVALSEIAGKGGRLDAAYTKALTDAVPARRALAGFLLARWGSERERKAAAALLKDADAEVRLRVAQGRLGAGSTEGVPALIDLLADRSKGVAWQAEELLRWWAGEDGPKPKGDWAAWWKGKPAVRPAKRAYRPRLLLVLDRVTSAGQARTRVWLCGSDGRSRWELSWEQGPRRDRKSPYSEELVSDFILLPDSSQIVAAEWSATAMKGVATGLPPGPMGDGGWVVTGRDLAGGVRWKSVRGLGPVRLMRLPTGTVFAEGVLEPAEVTPDGAVDYSSGLLKLLHSRDPRNRRPPALPGSHGLALAWPYRLGGGRWVFWAAAGPGQVSLVEVAEKGGKETHVPGTTVGRFAAATPLGNGHSLIAPLVGNEVREVDAEGRVVWRFARGAWAVVPMPGGNRLLSSGNRKGEGELLEVDRGGELVWRAKAGYPTRAVICFPLVALGF
jgi:hypothetical protein